MDIDELLAQAKPAERTIPLCLRGDLVAEFEDLERQLTQAQRQETDSLAGNGAHAIAERMEALREQMRGSTQVFRLRALPRPKFRALVDAHPPRKDAAGNVMGEDTLGVNTTTVFEPLIRACLVDPVLDDDQWAKLDTVLSSIQYDSLAMVAWAVNRGEVDIPFSPAASRLMNSSVPE